MSKIKVSVIVLIFILAIAIIGWYIFENKFSSKSELSKIELDLQACEDFFSYLELMKHEVYCPDINRCREPCWQDYENNIRQCLELRGEEVTLEKINAYLDFLPDQEFFAESRQHCYSWAKTENELEQCLSGYSSECN